MAIPAKKGVHELFSGKVTRGPKRGRKAKKKAQPKEALPKDLKKIADLYAAGKTAQKELEFKVRFAEHQVKEFCLRRYAERYAAAGNRPPGVEFQGEKSHFTFVQTSRINLGIDKVGELRELHLPIDEHTELKGIRIDYEAARKHGIAEKLQEAISSLDLSAEAVEECFVPDVQPREGFFEALDNIVRESLQKGESLPDKMYQVLRVLNPSSQVRNLKIDGMNVKECFEFVIDTEITVPEEGEGEAEEWNAA
ncbi:MAG: hypothetical protein ACXWPM_12000 [Bdellovibrionota bacterium]